MFEELCNLCLSIVDALCPEWEQAERRQLRHKYIGRPRTANVMAYKDEEVHVTINNTWSEETCLVYFQY